MNEIAQQLLTWANEIKDVASAELPEFARQFVWAEGIEAMTWLFAALVLGGLSAALLRLLTNQPEEKTDPNNDPPIMIVSLLVLVASFPVSLYQASKISKCIWAPRVVLVDAVVDLAAKLNREKR